jgi:hypothetical protein
MKRARRRSPSEGLQRYWERQEKKWTARYGQPSAQTAEEKYRRGDNTVLLRQLLLYLTEREPVPEWLRVALMKAIWRGVMGEFDRWDEAFGPPVQTEDGRPARGKTRAAVLHEQLLQIRICDRIVQLEAQGEKVDKGLFESVAAEFCIGRSRVEKIYYNNRALVGSIEIVHAPEE